MTDSSPAVFVLYGATGDLARRMVLPAFYQLAQHGLMPPEWALVGSGRGDLSHDEFRGRVRDALEEFGPDLEDDLWEQFSQRLRFAGGGFGGEDAGSLPDVLDELRGDLGDGVQLVHYLAIPPSAFVGVTEGLGAHGLAKGARVVYEKPYGTSPEDFRKLDEVVQGVLDEEQVFRIDHFLGKEGTQNLHVLRFGNGLFDHVWSREHVRAVQIDVPETLDVADRASFYDATGALLDMVVTHLFQIAAEVAMEAPPTLAAADLQEARETAIASFRPLDPKDVVLGQFEGYRDIEDVPDDSATDTFAAVRLWVDTDRWRDVPFLLRTGKQLAASEQRVSLVFRAPEQGPLGDAVPTLGNVLTLSLSGSGALLLRVVVKRPGAGEELTCMETELPLSKVRDADPLPPYVRLLHDVVTGDRSLFTRPDGLAAAWDVLAPVLDDRPTPTPYARGSWGPSEADALAGTDGWLVGGNDS